jgi:hypothetical protein
MLKPVNAVDVNRIEPTRGSEPTLTAVLPVMSKTALSPESQLEGVHVAVFQVWPEVPAQVLSAARACRGVPKRLTVRPKTRAMYAILAMFFHFKQANDRGDVSCGRSTWHWEKVPGRVERALPAEELFSAELVAIDSSKFNALNKSRRFFSQEQYQMVAEIGHGHPDRPRAKIC